MKENGADTMMQLAERDTRMALIFGFHCDVYTTGAIGGLINLKVPLC